MFIAVTHHLSYLPITVAITFAMSVLGMMRCLMSDLDSMMRGDRDHVLQRLTSQCSLPAGSPEEGKAQGEAGDALAVGLGPLE